MLSIVECESRYRHFDKEGNVLIGITGDVGIMQIAPQYWRKESEKIGLDIDTVDGNIAMAKIILKKQGKQAWYCHR